jgi:two-component system, OmpR family, alkaline phosphatase synthesis response regulator PhoP
MNNTIAIVDDDKEIAHIESLTLQKEGYPTKVYGDGASFLASLAQEKPALVILDLMLPDLDGLTLLKRLREDEANKEIDVIIVSAKGMVSDKVLGLDLGADDYLEKPFSTLELASRVNARFRKKKPVETLFHFRSFTLDEKAHELWDQNKNEVALTQSEWDLLEIFIHHRGEALSRETLFNALWGEGDYESRALDVHIFSLRKKLNDPQGELIATVYGLGYRMNL